MRERMGMWPFLVGWVRPACLDIMMIIMVIEDDQDDGDDYDDYHYEDDQA